MKRTRSPSPKPPRPQDLPIGVGQESKALEEYPLWAEAIARSKKYALEDKQINFRSSAEKIDWHTLAQDALAPVPRHFLQFSSFGCEEDPSKIMQAIIKYLSSMVPTGTIVQLSEWQEPMLEGKILPQVYAVVLRGDEYCFLSVRLYSCTGPYAKLPSHLVGRSTKLTLVEFAKTAGDVALFCALQSELRAVIEPHRKLPDLRHRSLGAPFLGDDKDDNSTPTTIFARCMSFLHRLMEPSSLEPETIKVELQKLCNLPHDVLIALMQDEKCLNAIIMLIQYHLNTCDNGMQLNAVRLLKLLSETSATRETHLFLRRVFSDVISQERSCVSQCVLEALTDEPSRSTHEFHVLLRFAVKQQIARAVMNFVNSGVDTQLPPPIVEQCRIEVARQVEEARQAEEARHAAVQRHESSDAKMQG